MIRKLLFFLFFAVIVVSPSRLFASAVTPEETREKSVKDSVVFANATDYLEGIEVASDGNIEINISPDILQLIFTDPEPVKHTGTAKRTQKKENVSNRGYRVQVFGEAGNQATLQSRCRARGSMVLARFPKYRGQLYIFSKSPNWYCRVGNFKTSGEAAKAAAELRRAFPQFSGEIRTVKSTIVPK